MEINTNSGPDSQSESTADSNTTETSQANAPAQAEDHSNLTLILETSALSNGMRTVAKGVATQANLLGKPAALLSAITHAPDGATKRTDKYTLIGVSQEVFLLIRADSATSASRLVTESLRGLALEEAGQLDPSEILTITSLVPSRAEVSDNNTES